LIRLKRNQRKGVETIYSYVDYCENRYPFVELLCFFDVRFLLSDKSELKICFTADVGVFFQMREFGTTLKRLCRTFSVSQSCVEITQVEGYVGKLGIELFCLF
jgi:hypothetical protein